MDGIMKKRYFLILLLLFVLSSPITVRAAYNVKCNYSIHSAIGVISEKKEITFLTGFYVYVDEANGSYQFYYQDVNGNEKLGKSNTNITDYRNYKKMQHTIKYTDGLEKGGFKNFDLAYRNGNNSCPDLYSHYMGGDTTHITTASNYNNSISARKIEVSSKEVSSDGGKTWVDGENTPSDDVKLDKQCEYSFLTDVGSQSNNQVAFKLKFEKMKNHTKNTLVYNVHVTSNNYDKSFHNVLGQNPVTLYPLDSAFTGGAYSNFQLYIEEESIKKVLDGASCLAASDVYLYDNGNRAGAKEYKFTHDKNEALNNTLGEVYDGSSASAFMNAQNAYNKALQALKDAMKKHEDNKWSEQDPEGCRKVFDGIASGENKLINDYESAKSNLKSVRPTFDFKDGDKVLAKFKQYKCGINYGEEVYGCDVIPDEIKEWILDALNLVKYLSLALVIILGVLDFIKAAASGEADAMKKSGNSFLKRIIAVVILFLVPVIVELILNLVDIYGAGSTCLPE